MALTAFHETIIKIVSRPMTPEWIAHFKQFETTTIAMNNILTIRQSGTSWHGISTIYIKKVYKETDRLLAKKEFYLFLTEFNEIEKWFPLGLVAHATLLKPVLGP